MNKENFKEILLYNRIKLVYLRDFYKNLNCFKTTIITIIIIFVVWDLIRKVRLLQIFVIRSEKSFSEWNWNNDRLEAESTRQALSNYRGLK